MIIQLSGRQWNAVAHRIPDAWKNAMREHRTQNYGRSHNYDLPAICWRRLFDHLSAQATGPLGGNTRGPDALYSAIKVIIRRVMEIEQHPALTNRCVTGWRGDIIPAWGDPTGVRREWSPYPFSVAGVSRFTLLMPMPFMEREWKLTRWVSADPDHLLVPESMADCEQMELILSREFGPVGVDLGGVPQD